MIPYPSIKEIPQKEEAFRQEIRLFLNEKMPKSPSDIKARSWMGFDASFSRALGERGWIGLTLPSKYGGADRGVFSRYVLVEELLASGAPVSAHWIADRQSAPLINKFGSERQKQFHIPKICKGESFFCIGMSEPSSGSDLASITTRATPTPTGWLLNGRKIWTTNADHSSHMIALVRTSGKHGDRQQGLSQLIIDLTLPGVLIEPIRDLSGDSHFAEVTFEDVELGEDALIGTEGDGWLQVNAELAFERSGPERILSSISLVEVWVAYWQKTSNPTEHAVRLIGRLVANLSVLRAMSISITSQLAEGKSPVVEAALLKDLGTEFEQSIPVLIAEAMSSNPDAKYSAELIRTLKYTTEIAPTFSIRGGTREILRSMVARGMGLR